MRILVRTLLLALLAIAAVHVPAEAQKVKKDPNRITLEEIEASSGQNAYDLISSQRPAWLRTRGTNTLRTQPVNSPLGGTIQVPERQEIVVYVDGTRFGNQDMLRQLPISEVSSVEFLNASNATTRFGTGHTHGAILVVTRRS